MVAWEGMHPNRSNFQIGPPDWHPGTRKLLIVTAVVSLLQRFLPAEVLLYGGFPALIHPWTLVTATFFSGGLVPFIITAIMLMWFGNPAEARMGTKRFLGFYLGFGALGHAAVSLLAAGGGVVPGLPGSSFSIAALFVAFGFFHRHAQVLFMFLLPINAWTLVKVGLALDAVYWLIGGHLIAFGALISGLGALGYLGGGRGMVDGWIADLKLRVAKWKRSRQAAKFTVIQGGKSRAGDDPWVREDPDDQPPVIH